MTTAVIALVAALAALAVVALVAVGGRRARRDSDRRLSQALGQLGTQMETLAHDLTGALERVQTESRRARTLAELGTSVDLDEVLARTVAAAASLPGVDASLVRSASPDGTPLVAAVGVSTEEADGHVVTGPPDGSAVRAVGLSYHYGPGREGPDALRSGLAVPLELDGAPLGFLAVYSRATDAPIGSQEFEALETIAGHAGPAIENARRYREAKHLADQDALTGLANRRTFHDALAREVARAHRYDRKLAVVLIDLDDFKAVNDRIGHLAGDSVLAEVAERVREAVRQADVACRIGGDEFAVILPESTRIDAEGLFARVQATLRRRPPAQTNGLTVSGGIAELRADDDGVSLFERADSALYQAKASGKATAT